MTFILINKKTKIADIKKLKTEKSIILDIGATLEQAAAIPDIQEHVIELIRYTPIEAIQGLSGRKYCVLLSTNVQPSQVTALPDSIQAIELMGVVSPIEAIQALSGRKCHLILGSGITEAQITAIPHSIQNILINEHTPIEAIPVLSGRNCRLILGEGVTQAQIAVIPYSIQEILVNGKTPLVAIRALSGRFSITLGMDVYAVQVAALPEAIQEISLDWDRDVVREPFLNALPQTVKKLWVNGCARGEVLPLAFFGAIQERMDVLIRIESSVNNMAVSVSAQNAPQGRDRNGLFAPQQQPVNQSESVLSSNGQTEEAQEGDALASNRI